ncbi:hypothetical protein E7V67_021715 [[Empedobacter] haloabium]|uniref:C-type lysozyme inhibitor domain-containing protein n=1 Tax=[Empedobacter] haloabium TaxID=592317 RepID=A0ABZ1UHV8_9BURK
MHCRITLPLLLLHGALPAAVPAAAPAAPGPWSVIAPLVAGTYAGTCGERPGAADAPGAIAVGADGMVRSTGIEFDPRDSELVELWRGPEGKAVRTKVVLRTMYEEAYFLLLPEGDSYNAALKSGERTLGCKGVTTVPKLNERALAIALAPLLEASGSFECRNGAGEPPRTGTFRLAQGHVQLDRRKFDLTQPGTETLAISRGRGMQYSFLLNDGRGVTALYDARGKLKGAAAYERGVPVLGCGAED